MCHAFLTDTNFYQLLFQIDQSIAEEVRTHGCDCGGVLHAAPTRESPVVSVRPWTRATRVG